MCVVQLFQCRKEKSGSPCRGLMCPQAISLSECLVLNCLFFIIVCHLPCTICLWNLTRQSVQCAYQLFCGFDATSMSGSQKISFSQQTDTSNFAILAVQRWSGPYPMGFSSKKMVIMTKTYFYCCNL